MCSIVVKVVKLKATDLALDNRARCKLDRGCARAADIDGCLQRAAAPGASTIGLPCSLIGYLARLSYIQAVVDCRIAVTCRRSRVIECNRDDAILGAGARVGHSTHIGDVGVDRVETTGLQSTAVDD